MSGIVGIVNRNGEPVDPALIRRLTDFLSFRGPDAQAAWHEGPAALGHTLFRVTPETFAENQPLSLDGQAWITADARLDAREELRQHLEAHGRSCGPSASDAELVLHAYHLWDTACVEHLLGDFSFGIWDARRRRLFAARDHFGVRPFFHAQTGQVLVFSNTLRCVRLHPAVGRELDEQVIGDFLIRDASADVSRTVYASIQRLLPAHTLTWDEHGLQVRRYWTLPFSEPLHYRRPAEYVEHFKELLAQSIRDRLRTSRAVIFMSGGLDSTSVAALAREVPGVSLRAHSMGYARLFQDRERPLSQVAADALGIPLTQQVLDDYPPFPDWNGPHLVPPEPGHDAFHQMLVDARRQILAHSRVALTGLGLDAGLMWPANYLPRLVGRGHFFRLAREMGEYWWKTRRVPSFGFRTMVRNWLGRPQDPPPLYPDWLNESFAARLNLRERFRSLNEVQPTSAHPRRPEAYWDLTQPAWSVIMETYDAGITGIPLHVCHPFFDVRLLHYLLALPPFPWCFHKGIVREAMRGLLPEAIRTRPKQPLPVNPVQLALRQLDAEVLRGYTLTTVVNGFVRREAVPPLASIRTDTDPTRVWMNLRPYSLSYWARQESAG